MKSTFFVSEEEKMRILEMHSPKRTIVEQTLLPTTPDIKKGETLNLYVTPTNTNTPSDEKDRLDKRFMISKVVQDLNGIVRIDFKTSQTTIDGKKQTQEVKVMYRCENDFLETDIEGEKEGEVKQYKSESFVKRLRKKFCTKNASGQWVPRADFASTGTQTSDMV